MANLTGYVNPREIGNDEPNQNLGMDIFLEQELWDKYIAGEQHKARTWDVVWMMRTGCSGPAGIMQSGGQNFQVVLKRKELTLRVYIHPRLMALCVGLAKS
jgi:hypothetical protein